MLVVAAKTKGLFEEEVDDLMAVARAVGLATHGSASTGANSDSLRRKFQILDSLRRKSPETNDRNWIVSILTRYILSGSSVVI